MQRHGVITSLTPGRYGRKENIGNSCGFILNAVGLATEFLG